MSRSELATDNIEINWLTVFKCQDSFLWQNIPNRHRILSEIWGDTFFLVLFPVTYCDCQTSIVFCPKNFWLRWNRIRMLSQICCFTFFFLPEATDQVEAYRGNIDIKRVNGMKWKKNQIREWRALWLAQWEVIAHRFQNGISSFEKVIFPGGSITIPFCGYVYWNTSSHFRCALEIPSGVTKRKKKKLNKMVQRL